MNPVVVILIVIVVLILIPLAGLATIWALNTLFGLTIAYTFKTVLAAILINSLFVTSGSASRK